MTLDIMIVTKILSDRGTNALGDFEVQYLYDPIGVKARNKYGLNIFLLTLVVLI